MSVTSILVKMRSALANEGFTGTPRVVLQEREFIAFSDEVLRFRSGYSYRFNYFKGARPSVVLRAPGGELEVVAAKEGQQ